jgi:ArsR family transcriptional regulator
MATAAPERTTRRPGDDRYCRPPKERPLPGERAARLAAIGHALADPIRVQILDVLRKHGDMLCVCEIVPLFEVSQPTISHHLKVLRDAGLVDVERHGIWSNYWVPEGALEELHGWLD